MSLTSVRYRKDHQRNGAEDLASAWAQLMEVTQRCCECLSFSV